MLDGNENKSKGDKDLKSWVNDNSIVLKNTIYLKELDFIDFPTFVEKEQKL